MNDTKKPIHQLGAYKCTIVDVQKKEANSYKGKNYPPKLAVTFQSEDGRFIDGNFKLPLTDPNHKWDARLFTELCAACGAEVSKPSSLKGKSLAVVVMPYVMDNGKTIWNPKGFFDPKFLLSPSEDLDSALGNIDGLLKDPADDINF